MSFWHLKHNKVIYLYKGEEQLKVDGNFKDGVQPLYEWLYDVKPYASNGKDYVLVST